ncbi:phospholipase [Actinophytocola glycyrrhizae]|uniref:Phospholipase n=1 Tax=Actinophytocola glycyrrhizae TaxID=2044873 RepID=A0ABV9S9Q2_9PSEU
MATSTLRRAARAAVTTAVVAGTVFAGSATASAALDPAKLRQVTDSYLYSYSLNGFQNVRAQQPYASQLDWSSDGCSSSPDNPFGFNFVKACYRHDFGYRNYKRQSRFNESTRLTVDNNFKEDLYEICAGNWSCNRTADVYYAAVRQFGASSVSTAQALAKAS